MIDSGDVKAPYPQYRCPVDGEDLPLTEARITVTCERHRPHDAPTAFTVREATHADRQAIELICDRVWGETELDSFGRTFDVMAGENLIAEIDGELAGIVSLAIDRGEQAIVMLSVYPEHQGAGVGTALVREAAIRVLAKHGHHATAILPAGDDAQRRAGLCHVVGQARFLILPWIRERAMATRCAMPPERSRGHADSNPCKPTSSTNSWARWRASFEFAFSISNGNIMFCSSVRHGMRLVC